MSERLKLYSVTQIGRCGNPECRNIHVGLFDNMEDVMPSAALIIDVKEIPNFCEELTRAAYAVIAMKD